MARRQRADVESRGSQTNVAPMTKPSASRTLSIELDPDLARSLEKTAAERGWTPESLVEDCVRQNLEIAIRYRVLVEGTEALYATIHEIARTLGELSAPSGGIDLSKVCKYPRRARDSA